MFSWGQDGMARTEGMNKPDSTHVLFLLFFSLFPFAIEIAWSSHHRHYGRLHIVVWVC